MTAGGSSVRPEGGGSSVRPEAGEGHGRPTAGELLEAAIEHLDGHLLAAVPADEVYQLRVTVAALRVVLRELQAPEPPGVAAWPEAGYAGPADLAAAIRDRTLTDDQLAALLPALEADVAARLAVTEPRRTRRP